MSDLSGSRDSDGTQAPPAQTSSPRPSVRDVLIGSAAMIFAMIGFSVLDTINKILVQTYSPFFLSGCRSIGQVLILLALIRWLGGVHTLKTTRPVLQIARGLAVAMVSLSVTFAVRHLPLVETYVIGFLSPFFATLLATIFIGERATRTQWLIIMCAFTGVLIALRPGTPEASWYFIYPLGFAFFNGIYFVLTRLGARTETWQAQLFYVGLFAALALSLSLPWHWEQPPVHEWGLLAATGLIGTFSHLTLIFAFARAPTAVISPMVYTSIIWTALIGYFVFNDVPLLTTWIGGIIVIAAGIALIHSEARARS
ncbi:MAG: DMT family transporter [Pseudomonadota bacterium]